tara:strand:- start:861 stop:1232 length:372 start_codon:yes stop_codon:yes gene_type:complete
MSDKRTKYKVEIWICAKYIGSYTSAGSCESSEVLEGVIRDRISLSSILVGEDSVSGLKLAIPVTPEDKPEEEDQEIKQCDGDVSTQLLDAVDSILSMPISTGKGCTPELMQALLKLASARLKG